MRRRTLLFAAAAVLLAASCSGDDTASSGASPSAQSSAGTPTQAAATEVAQTPPASESRPQHVRFAPGQTFDAGVGVYYLDLATGAVEGWQLPAASPAGPPAPYPTSPSGRYLTYAVSPPAAPAPGTLLTAD